MNTNTDTTNKLHDAAVALLKDLEDVLTSPEGASIVVRAVDATLKAAATMVETISPGVVVPFEQVAFSWLSPKVKALVETELEKLDPTPEPPAIPEHVEVTDTKDAAQVIAGAVQAEVK